MKKVLGVYSAPKPHWVGDGFPARSLFSYNSHGAAPEPVPAAGLRRPDEFEPGREPARRRPAPAPRLRDRHHRLRGRSRASRLDRRRRHDRPRRRAVDDGGLRNPARGIPLARVHPHAAARWRWCSCGSTCRPRTRWPRRATRPCSTATSRRSTLPDGAGSVRVIAGEYDGHRGPARTLHAHGRVGRAPEPGPRHRSSRCPTAARSPSSCCSGTVLVNGTQVAREAQMVMLDRAGSDVIARGQQRRHGAGAQRRADRRADRRLRPVRDEHARQRSARRWPTSTAAGSARWPIDPRGSGVTAGAIAPPRRCPHRPSRRQDP